MQALGDALTDQFAMAVSLLERTAGRVIVSGMGKSGHIGHKIAATLSSTGTPSFFVHPSEASHGDLGMITNGDTLMVLSHSGETDELLNLILYAQQKGISLVAITYRAHSALAKSAQVTLLLPDVAEACPMGLAPTTSTTMMLALGDALAIALLNRRGFTAHDYKLFHPGGSLGRKLFHVHDLMHTGDALPLVQEDTPMRDALLEMTKKSFGCMGVVNKNGRLMGIVTDGDLRRHMCDHFLTLAAKDLMTPSPCTIGPHMLAMEALERMKEGKITSLFVVDDQKESGIPSGILHIHDLLRAKIL